MGATYLFMILEDAVVYSHNTIASRNSFSLASNNIDVYVVSEKRLVLVNIVLLPTSFLCF